MAGAGAMPPALTGRQAEQAVLSRCLLDLRGNRAPPHDVVLVGPRGNGKTALLRWFEDACAQGEPAVDVASLTPSDLPEPAAPEWASPNARARLAQALTSRCRRRPLAVLLDEAQTLDAQVGVALLNASQQARAQAPFLLVLAGTPGLPAHLDRMDASFWSRLGEGELGIGRLGEEAAKLALAEPLDAHGVDIDADALAYVAGQSQCYPYFVQLWGDALWQHRLAVDAATIVIDHARAVLPSVETRMANYCQRRFAELESEELVPAAVAVARLFADGDAATASDQEVDAALAAAGVDAGERYARREALGRLGYVWRPPNQRAPFRWHAGIPSLMDHVLRQAAA